MNKKRVVVTGYGFVTCLGSNPERVFKRMCLGDTGFSYIDRFDTSLLRTKIAGFIDYDFDPKDWSRKGKFLQ